MELFIFARFHATEGEWFLVEAHEALAAAWGDSNRQRSVVMPLVARLERVP